MHGIKSDCLYKESIKVQILTFFVLNNFFSLHNWFLAVKLTNQLFTFLIGYYAEQLSSDDIILKTDTRNSSTSIQTTKTTKKTSHIYKLSYAGPIVMGVGGNILTKLNIKTDENVKL